MYEASNIFSVCELYFTLLFHFFPSSHCLLASPPCHTVLSTLKWRKCDLMLRTVCWEYSDLTFIPRCAIKQAFWSWPSHLIVSFLIRKCSFYQVISRVHSSSKFCWFYDFGGFFALRDLDKLFFVNVYKALGKIPQSSAECIRFQFFFIMSLLISVFWTFLLEEYFLTFSGLRPLF